MLEAAPDLQDMQLVFQVGKTTIKSKACWIQLQVQVPDCNCCPDSDWGRGQERG